MPNSESVRCLHARWWIDTASHGLHDQCSVVASFCVLDAIVFGGDAMRFGLHFAVCSFLTGCAVNPSVRYQSVSDARSVNDLRSALIDEYVLQKNELRIEMKTTAVQGQAPVNELVVTNTKLEDQGRRLILLRGDQLWTRTSISLAKVENTDLIASAGVEVQDRRVELIQTGGAVLKALVPFVPGVTAGQPLPGCESFPASSCRLVPSDVLTSMNKSGGTIGRMDGLRVGWGGIPATAEETGEAFRTLGRQRSNGIYYAACRDVSVSFVQGMGGMRTVYEWRGRIADPRWVQFVAFPRKGNIRMHAQCGVSSTSEKDPTRTADELISAAVTQAVAVKEALDKARTDDAK